MDRFQPEDRYRFSLVDVCMLLHTSFVGTGDLLAPDCEERYRAWLRWRLVAWSPSIFRSEFDEAVRALVVATLSEFDPNIIRGVKG